MNNINVLGMSRKTNAKYAYGIPAILASWVPRFFFDDSVTSIAAGICTGAAVCGSQLLRTKTTVKGSLW